MIRKWTLRRLLRGRFIPLFDAAMPVVNEFTVKAGTRALLVDLDAMPPIGVVAAACRVTNTKQSSNAIEFDTDGIDQTNGLICLKLPAAASTVTVNGQPIDTHEYRDGLLRIRLDNTTEMRHVVVSW